MKGAQRVLHNLPEHLEFFLVRWTEAMRDAGYLELTTAKREDCILSFRYFIEPMLGVLAGKQEEPTFPELIRHAEWCRDLLGTAWRHHFRGVTPEMFVGCFKTLVHSVADILPRIAAPDTDRLAALRTMQRFADAFETVLVAEWSAQSRREADARFEESNRLLTLEKNKYENILASISDLVFVVAGDGAVLEANLAAHEVFGDRLARNLPAWKTLDLEGGSMDEVLRYYPPEQHHEVHAPEPGGNPGPGRYYDLKIIPLSRVSLASSGYILVLNDITAHVRQRSVLEQVVDERTAALLAEKEQLEEMNITLRHVMAAVEKERENDRRAIAHTVETVLAPALARVRREKQADVRKGYLDVLEDQLLTLAPGAGPDGDARLLKLTSMEMKVCRFIRAGSSTKDIAESLNLSPGTVQTHRKSIRRKLGIAGSDVNLYTFLQSSGAPAS